MQKPATLFILSVLKVIDSLIYEYISSYPLLFISIFSYDISLRELSSVPNNTFWKQVEHNTQV